uniref:Uncharacterized protein n=1 Tax=Arundo donax TaxID=35708 RepID=A0A0A9HLV9_ARUDO
MNINIYLLFSVDLLFGQNKAGALWLSVLHDNKALALDPTFTCP